MKTTFRNEINHMEEDFNIDEITVREDLGIDPNTIKNKVMQQISSQKHKSSKKRLTVFLVAAAVSTAVVGTTVVATTTRQKEANFSEKFNGDVSVMEIYEAKDFSFRTCDENLQAEYLGMIGDGDRAVASIVLTKKDGGSFLETSKGVLRPEGTFLDELQPLNQWYGSDNKDYLSVLSGSFQDKDYSYIFYIKDSQSNIIQESREALDYHLSEDGKTLNLFIDFRTEDYETNDGTMEISSRYLEGYQFGKKLASYPQLDESTYQEACELAMQEQLNFEEDCRWEYAEGKYNFYQIDKVRYDLPYEMRIGMDFDARVNQQTLLTSKNAPALLKKDNAANLKITPFQLTLDAEYFYTVDEINAMLSADYLEKGLTEEEIKERLFTDQHQEIDNIEAVSAFRSYWSGNRYDTIDYSNSKIITKDKKEYYFIQTEDGKGYEVNGTNIVPVIDHFLLSYSETPVPNGDNTYNLDTLNKTDKTCIIDIDTIESVIINGNTVYPTPKTAAEEAPEAIVTADKSKYQIKLWSYEDLKQLLLNMKVSLTTMKFQREISLENEGISYSLHETDLTFSATENEMLNLLNSLEEERENNLFITRLAVSKKDSEGKYHVAMTLTNIYCTCETADQAAAAAYIQDYVRDVHWRRCFEHFVSNGFDNEIESLALSQTDPNYEYYLNTYERHHQLTVELNSDNASHVIRANRTAELTVTPFKLLITAEAPYDGPEDELEFHTAMIDCWKLEDGTSKIVMKDGSEYYFITINCGASSHTDSEGNSTVEDNYIVAFSTNLFDNAMNIYGNERTSQAVSISVEDIASIILNGDTVYSGA